MATTVLSYTHFLAREPLYETEKPYTLRFTAPQGLARANIKLERHNITVRDIRNASAQPTLENDGCLLLDNFYSTLRYEDFDDDDIVKAVYLKEVANRLKQVLNAQHVQIFEHTVSSDFGSHLEPPVSLLLRWIRTCSAVLSG